MSSVACNSSRKPMRTRAWSSTSITRIESMAPSGRERDRGAQLRSRAGPSLHAEGPAQRLYALGHPGEAKPHGGGRHAHLAVAVVVDAQAQRARILARY